MVIRINSYLKGFSVAELLITVVVCGLLAAYAVPKVVNNNISIASKQSYGANQAIAMLAAAYQAYRQNNIATINTTPSNVVPYLNYLSKDTSSTIDSGTGYTSTTCSTGSPCYKLQSGGILQVNAAGGPSFCDTTPNSYIFFFYDPDGVYLNTGISKSIGLDLHFDGRVVVSSQRQASDITCSSPGGTQTGWGADAASSWFTWNG